MPASWTCDYDPQPAIPISCAVARLRDDYDAGKSRFNQTCTCDPTLIAKDCYVGVGACRVKSVYSCMSGSLFCAQAETAAHQRGLYEPPRPTTGSWDWDCQ